MANGSLLLYDIISLCLCALGACSRQAALIDSSAADAHGEYSKKDLLGGPCTGAVRVDARCNRVCCENGVLQRCTSGGGYVACPAAQGDVICISGKAFRTPYINEWRRSSLSELKCSDRARVSAYDAEQFLAAPMTASPLASVELESDEGWFALEKLKVSKKMRVAVLVDDASSASDRFYPTATIITINAGENLTNIDVPVVEKILGAAWGNQLAEKGALLVSYVDTSYKMIMGVAVTKDGAPPPWTGSDVLYFGSDSDKSPYFQQGGTQTATTGMVAIKQAAVGIYSGQKIGCAVESHVAGSVAGMFTFIVLHVSGC